MTSERWEARASGSGRATIAGCAATVLAYAILPAFAPDALGPDVGILLMGLILGLVAGLAFRLGPRAALPMAVAAGLTIAIRFPLTGSPVPLSILVGAVVAAEVWAIPMLLRRTGAGRLRGLGDVLWLLVVATGVSLVAGLIATAAAWGTVDVELATVEHGPLHVVRGWFVDDLFGLVVIMPAVLLLPVPRRWPLRRAPEFVVVALLSVATTAYVFLLVDPAAPGFFGWPYLILIGPIWAAVRLGAAASTVIAGTCFWLTVVATVGGSGSFTRSAAEPYDQLLTVEVFAITMGAAILVLGVLRDEQQRTLERAESSSRLLRDIVDATDAVIFAKDYGRRVGTVGRYVLVNRAWQRLHGRDADQALGRSDRDLQSPERADAYVADDLAVLQANAPRALSSEEVDPDGTVHQFAVAKFPLRGDDGQPWGVGGIATDVTAIIEARRVQERQASLLSAVFEHSPTPALRVLYSGAADIDVIAANAAMCRLMGAEPGAFEHCELLDRMHPGDREAAAEALALAAERVGDDRVLREQREVRLQALDGRTVWALMSVGAVAGPGPGESTEPVEVVVQFEDFTARREAEQALAAQALRDAVTGLPNRRALRERMTAALERLQRNPGTVTVFFCDLDRFKDVNDSLGHQAGDRMLAVVAGRLRSALRPEDTLARLGGDEFVALAEGIANEQDAWAVARRMMERLNVAWEHEGTQFLPSMSVGVARTSEPDVTPDELLRRADVAMYRAKESGRNQVAQYDTALDDRVQQAVAVQHDLRMAIDTGTLIVHHQPLVDLRTGTVTSTEALVRLAARDGSLVPPGLFIPEAEVTGLIVPMGTWVLERALDDVVAWRAAGREVTVSVNVSPAQLSDGFAEHVLGSIAAAGARPEWLCLEVTESALIHEPVRTGRELTALSRAGVRVALDDFGTGYSSLSWLAQLPVSTVKVDRSFVADLGVDDRKGSIVQAIIEVSHNLGFDVVAEGVETEEQRQWLLEAGCDRGQGYLFGRPSPAGEVALA